MTAQVTLLLDMGAAASTTDAIYVVSGTMPGGQPPGLAMTSLGHGNWELTLIDLPIGAEYFYKFRTVGRSDWAVIGWEPNLEGECAISPSGKVNQYNDRVLNVSSQVQSVGPVCFGSCDACPTPPLLPPTQPPSPPSPSPPV